MNVRSDLFPGAKSYSPITYEQAPVISDETIDALSDMEAVCDRIAHSKEPSLEDLELYDQYRTAVQYQMRKSRFVLFRRLYDIVNMMVDNLQDRIERDDELAISPAQIRLYLSMFLDQTRAELEEQTPGVVIDQRKQTVSITMVEVDKSAGRLDGS